MREIEFRGYNRKNKQWLYGFYLQNRGAHFVCPDEFANSKSWEDYEIDPDSLGQFTGLFDKNKHKIYEGDIVSNGWSELHYIRYDDGKWDVVDKWKNWNELLEFAHTDYNNAIRGIEVVGNMYDNPEMIHPSHP